MHIRRVEYEGNLLGASPREAKRRAKRIMKAVGDYRIVITDIHGVKHNAFMVITSHGTPRVGQGKMNGKKKPQNRKGKNKRAYAAINKNRARFKVASS